MAFDYYLRGWLAITLVQQFGVLIQVYIDSESLQRAFLQTSVTRKILRPYAMLFFINGIQQLVVKGILQFDFHNRPLHAINIANNFITTIFILLEIFLYEHFQFSTATVTQLAFSALTFIFTLIAWNQLLPRQSTTAEQEPRTRKLFAKHYMESQIAGLQTEPKKNK
ncbi:hypothetical protein M3Y96_00690400 [Aphelenchoides besseyi]|nr:hypothetical protein M3Y96_00690400 [Aphelenchoides besseyi]